MNTFKYVFIIDAYNFSYSIGEECKGSFLISTPIVNKSDLIRFMEALEKNTSARLEIKTDTQLSFMLITDNGFCTFQDRFSVFIHSMQLRLSHDICLDGMKKFIGELLKSQS